MLQAAADGHSIEAISTSYVAGGILVESYYVLVAATCTRSHGRMSNVSNMLIALMSLMDGGGPLLRLVRPTVAPKIAQRSRSRLVCEFFHRGISIFLLFLIPPTNPR